MKPLNTTNILTDREFKVMLLVSRGKYNKEVADILKCSEANIKKHLQNTFPKLGVQNRTEATLKFLNINGKLNH
jgi:DNA-binding NarL/FixJ family response regulator